jgi:hypothetical protein
MGWLLGVMDVENAVAPCPSKMESASVARSGAVAPPVGHPVAGSAILGIRLGLGVVAARANLVS